MKKLFLLAALFATTATMAQITRPNFSRQSQADRLNELYCSGMFKSADGTILDVESDPSAIAYRNILEWMRGRVAGLQLFTTRTGTLIPILRGGVPGVYIDEINSSPASLNSLSISDIAMVKVIKSPFYGGFNSAYGAIAIYTIKEAEEN